LGTFTRTFSLKRASGRCGRNAMVTVREPLASTTPTAGVRTNAGGPEWFWSAGTTVSKE